jgi:hypothetical protein
MRHLEDNLQMECLKWWNYTFNSKPKIQILLHHSPNGGYRRGKEAERFKKMGVRAGFPDLILCMKSADEQYIGLFIELKVPPNTQYPTQYLYQQAVEAQGYKYVIVKSFDQFKEEIIEYLQLKH